MPGNHKGTHLPRLLLVKEVSMPETAQVGSPSPTVTNQVKERRKGPRGQVFFYENWCKGCQICVDFCPTGTLAMNGNGNHPYAAHPENCTACHFCDTHCPDFAIVVKRLE